MLHDEFQKEVDRRTERSNASQPTITMSGIDFLVTLLPASCAAKILFIHFLLATKGMLAVDICEEFKSLQRGFHLKKETIIKCVSELYAINILDRLEIDETHLICRVSKKGILQLLDDLEQ